MRLRPPGAGSVRWAAIAVAAASLTLAGCGEVKNTIHPRPGTVNQVQVVLPETPNALYIGIYEAQTLGYFHQSDLHVTVVSAGASQDPVAMVHNGGTLIGVASQPSLLLHRNEDEPVVSVAAIVHGPVSEITVAKPKPGPSGGNAVTTSTTTTGTTPASTTATTATGTTTTGAGAGTKTTTTPVTTTTLTQPDATLWPVSVQQALNQPGVPTYDGLVVIVRKETIVDHAGLLRRFVQALARGYRAARANPAAAVHNLVTTVPTLANQKAQQLATLNAAMPYLFPADGKVWGWQSQAQWNTFGTWMLTNHLISNPNAVTDASTNELLQGQGV